MFTVELSYNTVKEEIEDLETKSNRKDIALRVSINLLESHHIQLMKFIEEDNLETQSKDKEAEKL
jgi:hypothetical protein